jgi:hypothetical protein
MEAVMTVRERLHLLVEILDEKRAETALRVLNRLTSDASDQEEAMEAPAAETPAVEGLVSSGRPFTFDSPLWDIVGMAEGGPDDPTDVSANKHKYLAEAYADLHEE